MTDPLVALQVRLGHVFARPELLREAVTHPSYLNEHPASGPHNQRLEFLGDSVLGHLLTAELFDAFPAESEGALSRRRAVLTNGRALAELALGLGLDVALRLGGSENTPEGRARASNLEDAFEALVGALYLDAGLEVTRARVLAVYGPLPERLSAGLEADNPKGRLQELVQPDHGNAALRYETVQCGGADHAKEYVSTVHLAERPAGTGRGPSKKAAEEAAAREALRHQSWKH
jgi:ribonuclease-3